MPYRQEYHRPESDTAIFLHVRETQTPSGIIIPYRLSETIFMKQYGTVTSQNFITPSYEQTMFYNQPSERNDSSPNEMAGPKDTVEYTDLETMRRTAHEKMVQVLRAMGGKGVKVSVEMGTLTPDEQSVLNDIHRTFNNILQNNAREPDIPGANTGLYL